MLTDMDPTGVVLATASADGGAALPCLVADGRALPLAIWAPEWPCARVGSLTELIEQWHDHRSALRVLTGLADTHGRIVSYGAPIDTLRLHAPVEPRQAFCTIGNYRRQIVEAALDAPDGASEAAIKEALDRRRQAGEPYVCLTSPQRVGAPLGELTIPRGVDTLDWEVEIAVVIGTSVRDATDEIAADAIAGYCVANDLTVRSEVTRVDLPALSTDWVRSKGMPGSLPLGPWFVPAWQIRDVSRLRLRLSVNDTVMQDDIAEDMLFGIGHQIAYLSRHTRLRPADVICTGSPAGFGSHHGRFLRDGDLVTAQVSGLGVQHLRCVQESQ